MTSVGCGINQDILRFCLNTAFNNCFQELVFNFMLFKRKVIHINNKAIIAVFNLCNNVGQVSELMLINLNHSQTLVIISINNSLDTCGLTCTAVTKEQHIVGFSSLNKSLCVVHQLLLLDLITYQII